jgi:hypothetical protein
MVFEHTEEPALHPAMLLLAHGFLTRLPVNKLHIRALFWECEELIEREHARLHDHRAIVASEAGGMRHKPGRYRVRTLGAEDAGTSERSFTVAARKLGIEGVFSERIPKHKTAPGARSGLDGVAKANGQQR